jgi:ABC-type transporter Mla subunit MlaD
MRAKKHIYSLLFGLLLLTTQCNSSDKADSEFKIYTIYDDVTGLLVGDTVKKQCENIGVISDLNLINLNQVIVEISLFKETTLTKSTFAKIHVSQLGYWTILLKELEKTKTSLPLNKMDTITGVGPNKFELNDTINMKLNDLIKDSAFINLFENIPFSVPLKIAIDSNESINTTR